MIDSVSFIYEKDPKKKTVAWANQLATYFRMYWRPLIDATRAVANRQVMYGQNDIKEIKESFDDEAFKKGTIFAPLPLLEVFVNTTVEEIMQQPPRTEVKAQDPLSFRLKDDDIQLLRARKILENDLTRLKQDTGLLPPGGQHKIPYDKFNGNVQQFDELQLDERDPEDMEVFKTHYHKLWYEIGAQAALNAITEVNKFEEATLRTMVKDVFSYKACAVKTYVDQITGEIKYDYIDPSLLWGIWGKTNDGTDDVCRGHYQGVTLDKWLTLVGDEFDWERDWKNLLWGINYYNNTQYTGFIRGGQTYSCMGSSEDMKAAGLNSRSVINNLDWGQAYLFKVWMGYMEWPSWEATSTFVYKPDGEIDEVDYDYELKGVENKKGYQKSSKYQQTWYRMYFLSTSSVTQCIYGFQKIYFQNIKGVYDQYSNGTICYWQEQGLAAVELSANFLNIANFAFYRFMWLLWHTRPIAEDFVIDEIVALAKAIQRETPQAAGSNVTPGLDTYIQNAIQQQRKGHIRLRKYPVVEGRTIPTLPVDGKNPRVGGADPTMMIMQGISEWATANIAQVLGYNPMRFGANPPNRESEGTEENTVAASQNATGYIYRSVQYARQHSAIVALNYISDIVQYKDTIPYKWLENLIGSEMFGYLTKLDKEAGHRLGIFIEDINLAAKRQRLMRQVDLALAKGLITIPQSEMLMDARDPKLALARLAIWQRQTEKRLRREAVELQQMQHQNNMQLEQAKQQTAKIPADAQVASAQIGAQAQMGSAQIQARGRENVKQMQIEGEGPKQEAKSLADQQLAEKEYNLKNQQPLTSSPSE